MKDFYHIAGVSPQALLFFLLFYQILQHVLVKGPSYASRSHLGSLYMMKRVTIGVWILAPFYYYDYLFYASICIHHIIHVFVHVIALEL